MILQQCSIAGKKYRVFDGGIQDHLQNLIRLSNYSEDISNFFQALSVCHTVQVAGSETIPLNRQQEEAAIEASFVIVDDDELSSCSEYSDGVNASASCDSLEDNTKQITVSTETMNNLNNPGSCASISPDEQLHKRTSSNAPRISFNVNNKVYPSYSRSISVEPVSSLPRPKSLAVMPIPMTPNFGRKHLPKIASPLTLNHPDNINDFNVRSSTDVPYKLTHRRTQSASVASSFISSKPPAMNYRKIDCFKRAATPCISLSRIVLQFRFQSFQIKIIRPDAIVSFAVIQISIHENTMQPQPIMKPRF